ncbi:MAG: galactose ABC transporter substrate-binding protein, partial [Eubacteriales bacterium]
MMKRIISLICASVFLMGCLCGCGRGRKAASDVHVFYYTYSDTYISSVRSALDSKLKDAGLTYQ